MKDIRVEISFKTILLTLFVVFGSYFLYNIKDILMLLFLSIIFSSALNPIVSKMEKRKIPRPLSIFSIYLLLLAIIVVTVAIVLPPLVHQTTVLLSQVNFPNILESLDIGIVQNSIKDYESLISRIGGSLPTILNAIVGTFSGVLIAFTLLVMTFYMILERAHLHKHMTWMFGGKSAENKAEKFITSLEKQLGGWVRGELTLMLIIGVMTYIGLSLLGIPFALPLAILAGVLEVVPNIGPTISAIPAVIIAFITGSPAIGGVTILLYILIQQLENNLIVPKVMSDAVGIHPLMTIVVLLAGFRVGGVAGMLLAVPIYITIRTVLEEYYDGKNPLQSHIEEQSK